MLVDDHEALVAEQQSIGQTQPVDLALRASGPWAQVPDGIWQGIKCTLALSAEEVQAAVLA
jgi:hypothetical protein